MEGEALKQKKLVILLAVLLCLAGLGLLLYPTVSQWLNGLHQSEVVADYAGQAEDLDDEVAEHELRRAREHNDKLTTVPDPFLDQEALDNKDYDTLLNFTLEGVMAYVEIPSIDVLLPVYHGVGTDVLAKGIGHIPETSLPVGGESTHAVLVGHSGMSNARLFTDLPELKVGDVFYVHVYNKTMTYTVDQIKTVLPSDTSDLTIVPGEDYVTLVTCVPVTVNSHRLLVRGIRTEDR